MDEIDKELRHFMEYWFKGLVQGLNEIDEPSQKQLLSACGKACAHSYTADMFRDARQHSTDMDSFLKNLASRFPGAQYERAGDNLIKATCHRCGCDLVRLGWVNAPVFCECSAANLRENLEQSLGIPVQVTIESSLLRGGPCCTLIASLKDIPPFPDHQQHETGA